MAQSLGRLEVVLGRYADAEQHLIKAERRHVAWGARPFLAETLADRAEFMMARDGQDAVPEACELLTKARGLADTCGAPGITHYVERVENRSRARGVTL